MATKATKVQTAISSVDGFGQIYEKFVKQMQVQQYSCSSIRIYGSQIAAISLHFGKTPEKLTDDDFRDYLSFLQTGCSPSSFKHAVCCLRCYFPIMGLPLPSYSLPSLRAAKTLPVVLSNDEIRCFLCSCPDLRSKFLFGLVYSCGLRLSEALHLEVWDIDKDRMMVHIRQSKGRKDRYVPLSECLLPYLILYTAQYGPVRSLFYGASKNSPLSRTEFYTLFKMAYHASGILKKITSHTLRHSYATHLLEMGANIVQVKELLGHSNIKTTMIYLHVAITTPGGAFSPLDRLFPARKKDPTQS